MSMWIQLLKEYRHDDKGIVKIYKPGDWIETGHQSALYLIGQGIASKPNFDMSSEYVDKTSGIVMVGKTNQQMLINIQQDITQIDTKEAPTIMMLFSENMIWSNAVDLKREMITIGFKLLNNWDIAIPLLSYDTLACHIGNQDERDLTEKLIHDLRVPVYNTNLIFVRRCDTTKRLFDEWNKERQINGNESLAFHRAMYKVQPILCALPVSWCKG